MNWEAATAGLVRVGKPSPLWMEPPFVSFAPKTEMPGHRERQGFVPLFPVMEMCRHIWSQAVNPALPPR